MTKPTLTLTESGLLAVLLKHQRREVVRRAQRRAQRERLRDAFRNTLRRLFPALTLRTMADGSAAGRPVEVFPREI